MELNDHLQSPNILSGTLPSLRPSQNGHPTQVATICAHTLHSSASIHTPYCRSCVLFKAQARLEKAQNRLLVEGGPHLAPYMRDRTWNDAKNAYYLAKRNLENVRRRDQLRWENERAWEEAHLHSNIQRIDEGMGTEPASPNCAVCDSTAAAMPRATLQPIDKHAAWWERPGALAPGHKARTPPQRMTRRCAQAGRNKGSPAMRKVIQELRSVLLTAESEQQLWDARYKTEAAVRRKHHLDEGFHFEPNFWDSPISGIITRNNYRQNQDHKRMTERRARGNTPRTRPPRSSLSYSESAEEVDVSEDMKKKLELTERLECIMREERNARKVGEEVGYLYFVGSGDGLQTWKEDFLRSNHHLVWRDLSPVQQQQQQPESDLTVEYMDID